MSTKLLNAFSAFALLIAVLANLIAIELDHVVAGWLLAMLFMLLFCISSGYVIVKRWAGMLIDERNVMSLSRLQTLLWTIVILSAFVTAALYNVYHDVGTPLSILVPSQLWMAMGISTVSLVGTPLILGQKAQKDVPDAKVTAAVANVAQTTGQAQATITTQGTVIGNTSSQLAAWSDVVTGDEITNGAHLDLAKVQMLFFTIMIVAAYAYAVWHTISGAGSAGIKAFPPLDDSTIALLGISHSGYLVNKAVPRS